MPTTDFWDDLPRVRRDPKEISHSPEPPALDSPASHPLRRLMRRVLELVRALVVPGLTFGLMVLGALGGLAIWGWQTLQAAAGPEDATPVIVQIDRGTSTLDILAKLEADGVLISKWPALGYILIRGEVLRAGVYTFTPSLTGQEILGRIIDGNVTEYRVTIPEGWRIEQIGELLDAMEIVPLADFVAAATFDPVRYTLPAGISLTPGASLEGLLFPDTYEFRLGVTSKEIVATLLDNFSSQVTELAPTYDDVILASIVEREAGEDSERAKIAGVYHNRLRSNLRLDADPTVQYAKDTAARSAADATRGEWWSPVAVQDYQGITSPYNTYRIVGLPPTPIANPGLASLEATRRAEDHDYFYFFHTEDGVSVFSKTLDEHNAARRTHSLEKSE